MAELSLIDRMVVPATVFPSGWFDTGDSTRILGRSRDDARLLLSQPVDISNMGEFRVWLDADPGDFDDPRLFAAMRLMLSRDNGATWADGPEVTLIGGARSKDLRLPYISIRDFGVLTQREGSAEVRSQQQHVAFPSGMLARLEYAHNRDTRLGFRSEILPFTRRITRALAYDQQTVQARSGGVNSLQQTTGQAVDAGDLVVVCLSTFFSNGTGGTWAVTDDASQTYTEAVDAAGDSSSQLGIFYKENHPGGTIKVTVNPDGTSADIDFTVSEVSGAATSEALDKTNENSGTGLQNQAFAGNVATGTLAQADEIIFFIGSHTGGNRTLAGDTGDSFSQIGENEDNSSGQTYHAQYKIVASTTSATVDFSGGTASEGSNYTWFACVATFKQAAAGGTVTYQWLGTMGVGPVTRTA